MDPTIFFSTGCGVRTYRLVIIAILFLSIFSKNSRNPIFLVFPTRFILLSEPAEASAPILCHAYCDWWRAKFGVTPSLVPSPTKAITVVVSLHTSEFLWTVICGVSGAMFAQKKFRTRFYRRLQILNSINRKLFSPCNDQMAELVKAWD